MISCALNTESSNRKFFGDRSDSNSFLQITKEESLSQGNQLSILEATGKKQVNTRDEHSQSEEAGQPLEPCRASYTMMEYEVVYSNRK